MLESSTQDLPQSIAADFPPTDDGLLRDLWYFGALSADVKAGKQIRRMVLGEPVLIGRTPSGKVFAMRDICPHRLVPLSAGKQLDHNGTPTIECPYHGWRFDTDGVCQHMPSLVDGNPYDPQKVKVRHYPLHETNGIIFIYVSSNPRFSGEPQLPPPDFGIRSEKPKFVVSRVFDAHMDPTVVQLMDPGHVGFIHSQWWWRPKSAELKAKKKDFVPRNLGWAMSRHRPSGNSVAYKWIFGDNVTTEISYLLPGFRWETIENEKSQLISLTCPLPLSANKTLFTQITYWENAPLLNIARPILPALANVFLQQDGDIVAKQTEGAEFQKSMLYIDDLDTQSKWYLRLKKEWNDSRKEGREFVNPIKPTTLKWRS